MLNEYDLIKTFVAVTAAYDPDGNLRPLAIHWRDGTTFTVDKVVETRPAASLKVGGCGTLFSCRIRNKITHLFFENGRWFVEEKVPRIVERKNLIV